MSGVAEEPVPPAGPQREAGEASSTIGESTALAPRLAAKPAAPMFRAAPRALLQADSARSQAGAGSAVTAAQSTANMTAEQWLVHLVELKAQGRQQDFQDSLAQFRRRYPGYRIPESLTLEPAQS